MAEPDDAVEAGRLQLLGRLLPGALHELANPLLALGGTAELLASEAAPGTREAERLDLVRRTADEIADVVRSLQRLARERREPERELELAAFVRETAALARRFSGVKDVELDERVTGGARLHARPALLRQALLALLLDAFQGAEAGSTVSVSLDGLTVTVDAGAGGGPPAAAAARALGGTLGPRAGGGAELRLGN